MIWTFGCFQAIAIISSVQGMPMWMPHNFSSGKSQATLSNVMGRPTDRSGRRGS